jgi:hypothetical protein
MRQQPFIHGYSLLILVRLDSRVVSSHLSNSPNLGTSETHFLWWILPDVSQGMSGLEPSPPCRCSLTAHALRGSATHGFCQMVTYEVP